MWVDDPSFNLEYHVRHSALPEPGSDEQLLLLAARIFSQRLDRSKPLWETWFVEGLEDNRFAMISKTHHALIDGISGVDLRTCCSTSPPCRGGGGAPRAWEPRATPTRRAGARVGQLGLVRPACAGRAAASLATHPRAPLGSRARGRRGLSEVVWAGLNPAPATPLNVEIGPHRRFRVVRNELADFKRSRTPSAARSTTSC